MFRLINVIIPKNELTFKKIHIKEKKLAQIKQNFVNMNFFLKNMNFSA